MRGSWHTRLMEPTSSRPTLREQHSPDGRWWWNGITWLPAFSVDGTRWWNGVVWVPIKPRRNRLHDFPPWLIWLSGVWVFVLVAWVPIVFIVAGHHNSRRTVAIVAVVAGGLAALATMILGGSLGYRREWASLWWLILVGTATTGVIIFFVFESSIPANAPDDPGVGLGAMVATVALVPVITLFLWTGGAMGFLARKARPSNEPVPSP
jgi:hypothetical protein